ncbi:MAG: hypothetical protein PHF00_02640, partial [Elusimicrobia bacterium]|nr:hypothetical protein [Elusimicrobiota bacterium]
RAALKPKGAGRYAGPVTVDIMPQSVLQATLWLGAPSPAAPGEPAYDRELLLVYKGLPGGRRLRLARAGEGKLRFAYWDLAGSAEPIVGEVSATDKKSL